DVVDAGPGAGDHPQFRRGSDQRAGDLGGTANHDGIGVGEIGGELFRGAARAGVDGPPFRAEDVERGGGQVVSNYDVQERTDEERSASADRNGCRATAMNTPQV